MSTPVSATTVSLPTPDGPMLAYDAMPARELGPAGRGGVIVFQEAFGVNDHIEDVTRRLAAAGYRALAPHIFHRTGDPTLSYDDLPAVVEHMQAVTTDGLLNDFDACIGHLRESAELPPDRIGVIGFCMGGSVVALVA